MRLKKKFHFQTGDKVRHRLEGIAGIVLSGSEKQGDHVLVQFRSRREEIPCVMLDHEDLVDGSTFMIVIFVTAVVTVVILLLGFIVSQVSRLM